MRKSGTLSVLGILAALTPTVVTAEGATLSGSGFVIGTQGEILTAAHVVADCSRITVQFSATKTETATLVARDAKNDLAVVQVSSKPDSVAVFREGAPLRAGDTVIGLGYPLAGLLASTVSLSSGIVNVLAGLGDDSRYLQISTPVQPGNSGGPLLDTSGHVVGVVAEKLNAIAVAKYTGDIPENVGFAIKAEVARAFLNSRSIHYRSASSDKQLSTPDVGDAARPFTVYIECQQTAGLSATLKAVPPSSSHAPGTPRSGAGSPAKPKGPGAASTAPPDQSSGAQQSPAARAALPPEVGPRPQPAPPEVVFEAYNLGVRYAFGTGVKQDYKKAAELFLKAAMQGLADAQYNLGALYDNGLGVAKDPVRAVMWYHSAAEQNHPSAQLNLGLAYANGTGVAQDYAEAARWFRRAADQGVVRAQYNLAALYANGRGVPQSHIDAYAWFNIAAASGDLEARDQMRRAAESMSPEQLKAARALANKLAQGVKRPLPPCRETYPNGVSIIRGTDCSP